MTSTRRQKASLALFYALQRLEDARRYLDDSPQAEALIEIIQRVARIKERINDHDHQD